MRIAEGFARKVYTYKGFSVYVFISYVGNAQKVCAK